MFHLFGAWSMKLFLIDMVFNTSGIWMYVGINRTWFVSKGTTYSIIWYTKMCPTLFLLALKKLARFKVSKKSCSIFFCSPIIHGYHVPQLAFNHSSPIPALMHIFSTTCSTCVCNAGERVASFWCKSTSYDIACSFYTPQRCKTMSKEDLYNRRYELPTLPM